ncbi:MAG: hypothetical protein ACKVOH_02995 [Chlamydiales bacterium]
MVIVALTVLTIGVVQYLKVYEFAGLNNAAAIAMMSSGGAALLATFAASCIACCSKAHPFESRWVDDFAMLAKSSKSNKHEPITAIWLCKNKASVDQVAAYLRVRGPRLWAPYNMITWHEAEEVNIYCRHGSGFSRKIDSPEEEWRRIARQYSEGYPQPIYNQRIVNGPPTDYAIADGITLCDYQGKFWIETAGSPPREMALLSDLSTPPSVTGFYYVVNDDLLVNEDSLQGHIYFYHQESEALVMVTEEEAVAALRQMAS